MDNLRRFVLIISLVSFVLLCIGGFYIADTYNPKTIQREVGEPTPLTPEGQKYDPNNYTQQDLYKGNTLFIITPQRGDPAVGFFIAGYNESKASLNYIVVPADLKVSDANLNNTVMSLGNYFFEHGAGYCAKYLEALLAMDITEYVSLTFDDVAAIVDKIDSITINLPVDIKFIKTSTEGADYGNNVNFSKNEKLKLSGKDVVSILKFACDEGSYISPALSKYYEDAGVRQIHSKLTTDFISWAVEGLAKGYLIDTQNQDKFVTAFASLKDSFDTNLTEKRLTAMFKNISNSEEDDIGVYVLSGTMQVGKKVYIAYDGTATDLNTESSLSVSHIVENYFSFVRK